MGDKGIIRSCSVCDSAIVGGALVAAGEYSLDKDAELTHGLLSRRCARLMYGDMADSLNPYSEICPSPSESMGIILYVPNGKVVLPKDFFGIVAPGYRTRTLDEDFPSDELARMTVGPDIKLLIPSGITDSFEGVRCPIIPEYDDDGNLAAEIRGGFRASREAHYREHFA